MGSREAHDSASVAEGGLFAETKLDTVTDLLASEFLGSLCSGYIALDADETRRGSNCLGPRPYSG